MMEPYVIHFAPLQGYTDSVYREAHAQIFGGVETYYTPFVRLEKTGFRNKELRDLVPEANTIRLTCSPDDRSFARRVPPDCRFVS